MYLFIALDSKQNQDFCSDDHIFGGRRVIATFRKRGYINFHKNDDITVQGYSGNKHIITYSVEVAAKTQIANRSELERKIVYIV